MYFPYVRGRQYELLALRELVEQNILSSSVIPIIEPVKLSSTLLKTLEVFASNEQRVAVICNPTIGSLSDDMKNDHNDDRDSIQQRFLGLLKSSCIIKAHIMKKNSAQQISAWENIMGIQKKEWLVINNNRELQKEYSRIFYDEIPQFILIPDESAFRRQVRHNRVLFVDRFNKCARNSDYENNTDEFYSDDHIFYKEDGFKGFSDYSVIGKDYMESGFAPYAVAIHIVYFDEYKNLRIHHFVSDTNDDIHNPAGKFYEAVKKLVAWVKENDIATTESLNAFIGHYENQSYPGLGSIKKLSLMHHIELIGNYLDGVN